MPPADLPARRPAALARAGAMARRLGIHFYDLYYGQKDLHEPIPAVTPRVDLQIAPASCDDLRRVAELLAPPAQELWQHSIDIAGTCIVATAGRQVAGYSWLSLRVMDLQGTVVLSLPAGYRHHGLPYRQLPRRRAALMVLDPIQTKEQRHV